MSSEQQASEPEKRGAQPGVSADKTKAHAGTEDAPTALQKALNEKENANGSSADEPSGVESKPSSKEKDDKSPAGGYDSIAIPKRERGWTVRITIHKGENLPIADINSLSSDPYVVTQLYTDTPTRHKEDPPLTMRTPTLQKSTEPEWNTAWTIANVPSSGFKLKMRVYDEDPNDHDDRLGNAHLKVDSLSDSFQDIKEQPLKIEKRSSGVLVYIVRGLTTCFSKEGHMHGHLYVSIELLGRTPEDGQDGRIYTVGPSWWTKHFSPVLGRLANTQDPEHRVKSEEGKNQTKRYMFQANQIQLPGPVPKQLYHRYVEFKPWVQTMFTGSGIRGYLMSKVLHHQHDRVYHFDQKTRWGQLPENPGSELTKLFLDMVHYDEGGRIFTYVITLDALWRFTETGKEFGIDMLSKHTMHSDVGVYIAFSGEFFIRRLKKPRQPPPPEPVEKSSQSDPPAHENNPTHPADEIEGGPPDEDPPRDPHYYELVIDNDSGTYRPNAEMLPVLKHFLAHSLPGLHILVLDCQKDAEKMGKMKDEQRERKKREGEGIVYLQGSDSDSISSSDEEGFDAIEASMAGGEARHEHGTISQAARDAKDREAGKLAKAKRKYGHPGSNDKAEDENEGPAQSSAGAEQSETKA